MAPIIPPQPPKPGNAASTNTATTVSSAPTSATTRSANNNAAALRAARRSRNAGNAACSITATFAIPNPRMMMMNHPRYSRHPFRRDMEEHDSEDDDDEDEDDEDYVEVENLHLCLHCRVETDSIQVRCDECTAYICNNCHWCHEYQANHEIRVCDRCDGFYCRNCDEMDQCDDCHQVFCTSCSTLLSCKFCGGGLCEDCATACGRCGIVLCSRDSKFAVECDTCRLPYCLVCLASGSKDACVRCGSRPSKRMEQLVHLRLKSIYKAFKQNTSHHQNHLHGGPASFKASFSLKSSKPVKGSNPRLKDDYDFDDPDDLDALFHAGNVSVAAAAATSKSKHSAAGVSKSKNSVTGSRLLQQQRNDSVDSANRFKEEKERADAAAAALLAELDEEEEIKGKNNKKKKKKNKSKQPPPQSQNSGEYVMIENKNSDGARSEADSVDDGIIDDVDDDVSSTEYISALAMLKEDYDHGDRKPPAKIISPDGSGQEYQKHDDDQNVDLLEKELLNLVANEDIDGLESLLESIKGIPGRAGLRKNAKKALKRLRLESAPQLVEETNETTTEEVVGKVSSSDAFVNPDTNGYLQVVSLTHNKPASQCATPGSQHGIANAIRSRTTSSGGPLKSECVMHVRPLIVGWMIGKGGQRIRDLMEESGARIWIDQDSMGSQDPRLLYISGSRINVEIAMGLLSDLVSKYQPLSSSHCRSQASTNPPLEKVSTDAHAKDASVAESADNLLRIGSSLSNRNVAGTSADVRARQVVFCDPRFVPLLIGKRGWTIKNIQDTTGAKVDIDQTVNPRRITVSGSEGNVEKAMRMVRDVLSYPHSQLHGCSVDDTNIDDVAQAMTDTVSTSREIPNAEAICVDVRQLEENLVPVLSVGAGLDVPLNAPVSAKIPGHSPPSSLIMTGDAKSTISASSSLSSTPEPILPSSSTTQIPQLDIGPATFSPQQGRTMFNAMGGELAQGSCLPLTPMSPAGNAPPFQLQVVNNAFDPRDQNFPPKQHLNPVHANLNLAGTSHHTSPNQHTRPTFLSEQQHMFVPPPNPQHLSMSRPGGFPPSQSAYNTAHDRVDSQGGIHNTFLPNTNAMSGVGSTGFWNGIGTSQGFTPGGIGTSSSQQVPSTDNFHLDAAVEFLEHSQQLHAKPLSTSRDTNGFMGLSVSSTNLHNQTLQSHQDNLLNFTRRQDDAQMVDSLFGPSTTPVGTGSMLSGLQGLSLNPNEAATGLWGSGDPLVDASSLRPLGSDESRMFGGLSSPHPPTERKSESRFLWGESGHF